MRRVALVYQPYKPESHALAEETAAQLRQRGYEVTTCSAFELARCDASGVDLAVAFGGDGTILRAARWLADLGVPIVGVGMGTLSFLAELGPDEVAERLGDYLAGDFWLDERAMLLAEVNGERAIALNDVVLGRGGALRALRFRLWVDDAEVAQYVADGMIVATATGSTAYALAAGGPIMAPELRDVIVQPIVPHLPLLRTLIVPPTARVELRLDMPQDATLTVDGQHDFPVTAGERVYVTVAPQVTRFARRGARSDFYRTLVSKLCR